MKHKMERISEIEIIFHLRTKLKHHPCKMWGLEKVPNDHLFALWELGFYRTTLHKILMEALES